MQMGMIIKSKTCDCEALQGEMNISSVSGHQVVR